jgi:hypothetical protein
MMYDAFWDRDRERIDGYVYMLATTTESIASYTNCLDMRGFQTKIVRFNYDNSVRMT